MYEAYQSNNKKLIAFTGKTIVPNTAQPTDYEKNILHLETAEFITANCAISKAAFKKVNGFDENFPIAWREDSDMHFKLIESSIEIQPVKNAVVVHPVREASWGISLKEQKKSLFNALLYKKHKKLYKQRISASPVWNYYLMILFFGITLISLINGLQSAAIISFAAWFLLLIQFIYKRLKSTSKKIKHVLEMIVTSAIIPFLSVFWTLYGSVKYKTLLL